MTFLPIGSPIPLCTPISTYNKAIGFVGIGNKENDIIVGGNENGIIEDQLELFFANQV